MSSCQVRLSKRALADLDGIADYLGERNPSAAARVLRTLRDAFDALALSPNMGVLRDDLHPGLRIFSPSRPAQNYVICFYPLADGVEISDIVHGARDWPELFRSGDR